MKVIDPGSPAPLNTHAVAVSGVIMGAVGIAALVVPPIANWIHPLCVPGDVESAFQIAGGLLASAGLGGAYKGRPLDVH